MIDIHKRNLEVLQGPEQLVIQRVQEIDAALVSLKVGAAAAGAEFNQTQTEATNNYNHQVDSINPASNPLLQGTPTSPEVASHIENRRAEEARQAVDAALWN